MLASPCVSIAGVSIAGVSILVLASYRLGWSCVSIALAGHGLALFLPSSSSLASLHCSSLPRRFSLSQMPPPWRCHGCCTTMHHKLHTCPSPTTREHVRVTQRPRRALVPRRMRPRRPVPRRSNAQRACCVRCEALTPCPKAVRRSCGLSSDVRRTKT